ncbi:MAG: hypothetical protein J5846_05100 [Desulfovibrio sp.]|nr:hypothetical protein [Desulfovibrio sp.]
MDGVSQNGSQGHRKSPPIKKKRRTECPEGPQNIILKQPAEKGKKFSQEPMNSR